MKAISIIAVLLLLVVNALAILPAATPFRAYLASGGMALSLVALIAILVGGRPGPDDRGATAQAARPMSVPSRPNQADAEIVSFLALLQARGRLVDFLMDTSTRTATLRSAQPRVWCTLAARPPCWSTSESHPCAQRARDRRCRSPLVIRRTNTDFWAKSAAQPRSRECLSTTAGRRTR